jgi:hypothetical protein
MVLLSLYLTTDNEGVWEMMCGPFHVQDALPLGKEPLVPTKQENAWTPQLLCAS